MMATARFPPPEEVVIEGDSTEDEDEVEVVAPQSRKRKRASLIADEDDETDDDGNGDNGNQDSATKAAAATPARRTIQSKLGFAEVRRMEHGRKDDEDNDDDDDEVEIVGPPVRTTPGSGGSGRKSGRLTILASDDEQAPEESQPQQQMEAANRSTGRRNSTTPKPRQQEEQRPRSASSSTRRSSRIERKRKEKELLDGIARRLDYPVLENCLDRPAWSAEESKEDDADYQEDEEVEDEEDFEVEQEEMYRRPKKRQRRETENEVLHADGGEDLDEFIVGDDEIEYMDDDEKGVISVESSESEGEFDATEEIEAMRATRSRDQSEWFAIYLEYLEESMVDTEMDYKMRRYKNKAHFRTFHEAIRHIERVICSRRDTLRVNIVWPEELVNALKSASHLRWERVEPNRDCEACNRSGHLATFRVYYSGVSCDATELYRDGWMERLRGAMKKAVPVRERFDMGSTCHSRTLAYWQLLHAKQMLCAVVDAKRRENGNSKGRIPQHLRDEFYKKEYGRFKRLLNLVDRFSTETRQGIAFVPNVWKHVTRKHLESEFLPTPVRDRDGSGENRRGTLDSLVGESEDEEEEDEEDAMEQLESATRSSSSAAAAATGASDEEKAPTPSAGPTRMKRATATQTLPPSPKVDDEDDEKLVDDAKSESKDFDDLMCLVCRKRPRDAAVVHGMYLHYYSCYGCAKRQLRAKDGCVVCERPIDRVLRVLPLTTETRRAIENESKALRSAQ